MRVTGTTESGMDVDADDAEGSAESGEDGGGDPAPSATSGSPGTTIGSSAGDGSTTVTVVPRPPEPSPSSASTTTGPATGGGPTSIPGSVEVESSCGSIVVVAADGAVELVETRPDPGYGVDVKSSGPEVEVSLEGRRGHCELKAEYERGRLVTSEEGEGQES